MKDLQLSPDQWGARLQQCKDAWRVLPEAERALYTAKAAEEEGLRNEASIQPLPPKSQSSQAQADHLPAAFDAASELGRNALKKLSKHRVFASYKKLKESDLWTSHGTGLASFDGALSLDLIDLRATEDEIFETWQEFASSKRLNTNWVPDADCEIHHRTCWASYGCCVRSINKALTNKLVHGLAGHLSEGAWLK